MKPKDLPLLPRWPLPGRVFPWGKLQVTRLDSLLLQPRVVCERASLWAKPRVMQLPTATRRSQLPRSPGALFWPRDVLQEKAIRPESATVLAKYKCRQIQRER
jgi:hypothetical protein